MATNGAEGASARPKCKYWNKCFRKEKKHLQQFAHPGEDLNLDDTENDQQPETMGGGTSGHTHVSASTESVDLSGKKVLFLGKLKTQTSKVAAQKARECGCVVTELVREDVDIVVEGEETGRKGQRAKDLGLRVVTEKYWSGLLGRATRVKGDTASKGTASESMDTTLPQKQTAKSKLKRQRTHNMSDDSDDDEGHSSPSKIPPRRTRSSSSLAGASGAVLGGKAEKKADPESDMDTSDENEEVLKRTSVKRALSTSENTPKPKKQKADTTDDKPSTSVVKNSKKAKKIAKCKYWEKCYRKEKAHLDTYLHPGDDPSELQDDDEPKTLADGEEAQVDVGTRSYTIKRTGDVYKCNCVGWKTQVGKSENKRTCCHLKEFLGEENECKRTGTKPAVKTGNKGGQATIFRAIKHKNVSVLLAQKWSESKDPTGWWMSEKLDGVRAFWDGKTFYSRLGNEFIPPPWFIKNFPSDMTLDGELFGGRAKFQSTVAIVKCPGGDRWKELEYHIFDAPSLAKEPFESRVKKITEYFESNKSETAVVVEHKKVTGKKMIEDELKRVESLGGEGLMIRQPKSKYETCRSPTLLKIKNFYDAEAVVIGYEQGKGRNAGRVGALRCRMACGKEFSVGSGLSDKERNNPPKKGSIITYKFQEFTNSGSPRFPTYIGVRIDAKEPKDAVLPVGKLQAGGKEEA